MKNRKNATKITENWNQKVYEDITNEL